MIGDRDRRNVISGALVVLYVPVIFDDARQVHCSTSYQCHMAGIVFDADLTVVLITVIMIYAIDLWSLRPCGASLLPTL